MVKSCFFQLRLSLKCVLTHTEFERVIHAFKSSRLDYCNVLYSCLNKSSMVRLQVVQNAAARLLNKTNRRSHITPILKALHWLPICFRVQFKILTITYRALHDQAPSYIQGILHVYTSGRSLRSSGQDLLTVPRTRFKTRGDRAFCVVAPRLWNSLPLALRALDSVGTFKKCLNLKSF